LKKIALIVAGGGGTRMNSSVPKQFISIHGIPVLMHTFKAFLRNDSGFEFILVLPDQETDTWKQLCEKHSFAIAHRVVSGGQTRFHSVKNGLKQIHEEGIVFIHDGVRPLVSSQTIDNCYKTAMQKGNALPVIAPSESVRETFDGQNHAVDRSRYFLVQTPQTFLVSLIKTAYNTNFREEFTDDASVLEKTGTQIHLVEGNRENIKITWPGDLIIAEAFLKNNP
jgi:2-C-methyl-D-erythritol 4-phosphate cytidylyltransferase